MTVGERQALLTDSLPEDQENPKSRRFAIRRSAKGIEFFEAKFTEKDGDDLVFHGHPATRVPYGVLKQFQQKGLLNSAEVKSFVKKLAK